MALTGTYHRTLDDKQRIAMPKRLRDAMGGDDLRELYVAPESNRSLSLFTPSSFERRAQRLEEASHGRSAIMNYLRLYYSQAERVELDGQNRFRLPDRLREFAKLDANVVLLGVHAHVEIWDEPSWQSFLEHNSGEFDKLASEAF